MITMKRSGILTAALAAAVALAAVPANAQTVVKQPTIATGDAGPGAMPYAGAARTAVPQFGAVRTARGAGNRDMAIFGHLKIDFSANPTLFPRYAIYGVTEHDPAATFGFPAGHMRAIGGEATHSGTNNASEVVGIVTFSQQSASGTVASLRGADHNVFQYGAGAVTSAYGGKHLVEIGSAGSGGTVGNAYGLYTSVERYVSGGVTTAAWGHVINFVGLTTSPSTIGSYIGNIQGVEKWAYYASDGSAASYFGPGIQIGSAAIAKPTCEEATRGRFHHNFGGAGVKDTVEVCAKDAADAYAWRVIY
jgi:hypothetical protein